MSKKKGQQNLGEKLAQATKELEKLKKELEQKRNEDKALRAQLEQLEKELELLKARMKMLQMENEELREKFLPSILVVEDDQYFRQLIKSYLPKDYYILEAADGIEAQKILFERAEKRNQTDPWTS